MFSPRAVLDRLRGTPPNARVLAVSTFVGSTGTGLFLASSALFFTRVVGLTPAEVGFGLSTGSALGFAATVPVGRLADRFGARKVFLILNALRGAGYFGYLFVHGFAQFMCVACVLLTADRTAPPVNQAMVGQLFSGSERARVAAVVRSIRNLGFTVGIGVSALALATGTAAAFRWLVGLNALSFLVTVVLLARLRVPPPAGPQQRPADAKEAPARAPWRHPLFVVLTVANGVLMLHDTVLTLLVPLWVSNHTATPTWLVSVLLMLNTVLAIAFQLRVTKQADTVPAAVRAFRRCGLVLAGGCLCFAAATFLDHVALAVAALVLGMVLHTAGELLQTAASWTVSFALAPEEQQGRFLAFFWLGSSGKDIAGPTLGLGLMALTGAGGWLVLAGAFLAAGLVCAAVSAPRQPAGQGAQAALIKT
ncbi:MFS transporter [Kitasatospora sp. NPDC093558]|uniref:MFS transporter n=1 Tax=Kitasatospora sp. NPDC093558 TaxID=3155201 RepID=UPI00342CE37D